MGVLTKLVPVLNENDMLLPDELYEKASLIGPGETQLRLFFDDIVSQPLLQLSDFNTLIARSQEHNAPVFDLTDAQLEKSGVVLEKMKKSMENFRSLFSDGADRIITLTENA